MEIFNIFWDPQKYLEFLPFLIRTSFFIMAVPIFTSGVVPIVIRSGLAFSISVAMYSGSQLNINLPITLGTMILGITNELLLSFLIFLTIRIFFLGPQLSGEIFGFQIGYSLMTIVQPFEETQLSVIADLLFIISMMLFFALDLHIGFFWGLKKSFELVPPFAPIIIDQTKDIIISRISDAFSVSIQILLPLILLLFVIEISTAIISRSVPQFNIFVVGFPIKIIIGLLAMTLIFDRISFAIGEFLKRFIETYSDLLKVVR